MAIRLSGILTAAIFAGLLATSVQCSDEQPKKASKDAKDGQSHAAKGDPKPAPPQSQPRMASTAATVDKSVPLDAEHLAKAKILMDNGAAYLISKQEADGGWVTSQKSGKAAFTAMALKALVGHPAYGPNHPAVVKGFDALLALKQPDGGIYSPGEGGSSYTSAVALMAFSASKNPQYAEQVRLLVAYLKGLQIVPGAESSDGSKIADDNPNVGGVSYGQGPGRPDLSNVGMWTEALHDAGVDAGDPALQRAAAFVSRLQSNSETNTMDWAKTADSDGGFIYAFPGGSGRGASNSTSYGSMTYTGFKSLLYAGVDRNDSRVKAAYQWIRRYWQLDGNPNVAGGPRQGLFYYYYVFAKCLAAWGEPVITDLKGTPHNWRHELIDALASRAKGDGSWVNDASDRWWESEPTLATCYALIALQDVLRQPAPASNPASGPAPAAK